MLNARWLLGVALVASASLPACTTETSLGREGENAGRDASREDSGDAQLAAEDAGADTAKAAVCTLLLDQTCNDDEVFSGIAGTCVEGGACVCKSGFVVNPATGRCRSDRTPDAAMVTYDAAIGTTDAPTGNDAGKDAAGVCTPGADQTCNDSPIMSNIVGSCQANGTCVCKSGYVVNPVTGRCASAPRDAGQDSTPVVDVRTDAKTVCTLGMSQTCNDNLAASAVWGVCQADGTCVCNSGFVINPSSGKCTPATSTCSGSYEACGCGCCGGTTPSAVCYYPSAGDSLSTIKAADEAVKNSSTCATAGCSLGQRYLCCAEAAPEAPGSAQYSATLNVGALDRVALTKTGNDGTCMVLGIASPGYSTQKPMRVATPTDWGVEGVSAAACTSSSTREQAIGAQGTVTFSPSGASCAISAHMTVFFYTVSDTPEPVALRTMRIDADNIPIAGGMSPGYCK